MTLTPAQLSLASAAMQADTHDNLAAELDRLINEHISQPGRGTELEEFLWANKVSILRVLQLRQLSALRAEPARQEPAQPASGEGECQTCFGGKWDDGECPDCTGRAPAPAEGEVERAIKALELATGRLHWCAKANPGLREPEGRLLAGQWADEADEALASLRSGEVRR